MVKVTLGENLVSSTRDKWALQHPHADLTSNRLQAVKVIRAASQFFHLKKNAAVFSGYVRENQAGGFVIKLWHEGQVVRSLTLLGVGFSGALHAEVFGPLEEAVGWDLMAAVAWDGGGEFSAMSA